MRHLHSLLSGHITQFIPGLVNDPGLSAFIEAVNKVYMQSQDPANNATNQEVKIKQLVVSGIAENPAISDFQEHKGVGSFEIDLAKRKSVFSENAAAMLGLNVEETAFSENLLLNLRKYVHAEDLQNLDQQWIRAMQLKKDLRSDFRVVYSDGKITYLDWNVNNIFSEDGKLVCITGTLHDMTDRILNERNSATARLIIENSPTVLLRWRQEEGWPVEYISENVRQFGYTADDFISGQIRYDQIIYKDDLKRINSEVQSHQKQGTRLYIQVYRIVTKTGEIRWVEDRTMVEDDAAGDVIYHQGLLTDITDKIKAENALAESENRFRSVVQNSSDITSIISAKGIVTYKSPAFYRIFGYEPEMILGKSVFQLIHPDDLPAVMDSFKEIAEGRKPARLVVRYKHENGDWISLEVKASNELNNPAINGIVINSRDVTERINNQEQLVEYAATLEKINRELDQFAYIISHDLKAPLRAISNLSVWIEEDLEGKLDDGSLKNFDLLRSRIKRMESLITGVLEYSRAGRIKSELQPLNLNALVREIFEQIAFPENFTIEIQEDLPTLAGEKIAIEQVFSNYISNTLKYNKNEAPFIKIKAWDEGNFYRFSVSDNGPGIDPQFHNKIFEIFQTLNARDQVESTGVGLAIVKKIVEEKGGRVWVESSPGEGAEFFFTLPKNLQ